MRQVQSDLPQTSCVLAPETPRGTRILNRHDNSLPLHQGNYIANPVRSLLITFSVLTAALYLSLSVSTSRSTNRKKMLGVIIR